MRLTRDLYLEPRLIVSGAIPPLVTYSGRISTKFDVKKRYIEEVVKNACGKYVLW